MFSDEGFSSSAIRSFSVRARTLVEPTAGEDVGEDGGVVGDGVAARILREVAGERRRARRARTAAGRHLRAPGGTWSCRRRCGPPDRPSRPGAPAGTHRRRSASRRPRPPGHERTARKQLQELAGGVDHSRARGTQKCPPSLDRCRCRPTSSTSDATAQATLAGPDPPRRLPGVDPGGARARAAEPGRLGPRRRRHLRGVPRRPLRRQRDLPHRQLGTARAGPAPAHGPRDDLRAHRRLLHPDHAARAAAGVGHLAAGDRVDGGRDRRHPGPGPLRRPAPRRRLPLHRDGLDRRDRAACGRHVARARRSSRSCSPAVCSTPWGRSGCGSSGRIRVRWCSGTTRSGTR